MLYALRINEKPNLADKIFRRKIKFSAGRLCGFDCFYANCFTSAPNYQKLSELLGKNAHRLILPRGVNAPIGIDNAEIKKKILCLSAIEAVKNASPSSLALIDIDARYPHLVDAIAPSVGRLLIITGRIEEYETFCRKISKKYGASPIVTDSAELIEMCPVILAPDGIGEIPNIPSDAVLFAPDGVFSFSVDEECINYPFDTKDIDRYNPLDIYSALVIMSPKYKRKMPHCHSFLRMGKKYPLKEVISMITTLDIRGANNYNINIANLFLNKGNGAK